MNKISHKKNNQFLLNENKNGSDYLWPNSVKELESKAFSLISDLECRKMEKSCYLCTNPKGENFDG